MPSASKLSPWAVRGLYLFAAVLVLSPMLDLFSTVWPLRPGDFSWRYGAFGLMAGYLHTPILGLVLAMAVAYWQEHASFLSATGMAAGIASVLLLLVVGIFALDVLQMREMREAEVQAAVLAGGVLQEIKYLGALLVLFLLGVGGWQTGRRLQQAGVGKRAPRAPIVSASGV